MPRHSLFCVINLSKRGVILFGAILITIFAAETYIVPVTLASLTVTLFGIYYIISVIDSISLKLGGITGNIIKLLLVVGVVATLIVVSRFVFNGIANNIVNYDAYRLGSFIDRMF